MSDISKKDISDIQPSSSLQMQQEQKKQTQHTPTQNKKNNEATDPTPTSSSTKKRRRSGRGLSFFKIVVSDGTGAELEFTSPSKTKNEVMRTDPALLPPQGSSCLARSNENSPVSLPSKM
ncbi:hypothetical protein P9112_006998 [Eukaryota sp. TZLM1-RC]